MHLHPSFAERLSRNGLPKKGGGAPKGASNQCPRGTDRTLPPAGASGAVPPPYLPPRAGDGWEGARLPALHRGACRSDRTLQLSPGRASREREGAGVTRTVDRA
jgi:hypothetical protein